MAWQQLILKVKESEVEHYSSILMEMGAESVTIQDAEDFPLYEPKPGDIPLWKTNTLSALFSPEIDMKKLKEDLANEIDPSIFATLEIKPFEEQDWNEILKQDFKPMRFGKKLIVCPTWLETPDKNAITLYFDPGLAFGTGTHATTRLCLEWLDSHPPVHAVVIDYGCGSGILGIAALKLGAKKVYAIDYDPQALKSTKDNAKQNGFSDKEITALSPNDFSTLSKKENILADCLIANILSGPIIELVNTFEKLIKPNGKIVLSGILESQKEMVVNAYASKFHSIESISLDGWVRVTGIRNL